ncbi:PAS domain-containing protein [Gimesia chilikensis]|uniref:PAS domain-containing protein n=1 Tax=Gimesia chilikensis TaxID=2605989 RepID=UPI0011EDB9CA|nr:PAS domain-containing protein [Gimesia chilikensis]KAA0138305.1 PAS domain-containing protein [Gimesia chilikensis]
MEHPIPTGQERTFADHEIIVSKTDLKGRITYANQTFIEISGYTEEELLGQPHNLIRHPDMPRCVFKLLWDTIQAGEEIFAYVVNLCMNGDHYWVLAHVTPTWNLSGQISGYHSSRRVPERKALEKVIPLYRSLKRIEGASSDWRTGMQNATVELLSQLDAVGMEYDEYVFAL